MQHRMDYENKEELKPKQSSQHLVLLFFPLSFVSFNISFCTYLFPSVIFGSVEYIYTFVLSSVLYCVVSGCIRCVLETFYVIPTCYTSVYVSNLLIACIINIPNLLVCGGSIFPPHYPPYFVLSPTPILSFSIFACDKYFLVLLVSDLKNKLNQSAMIIKIN